MNAEQATLSQNLISSDLIIVVVRVVFGGIVFTVHGVHKAIDGAAYFMHHKPWPLADEIGAIGLPAQSTIAVLATAIQLVMPILLVAGFHTRLSAIAFMFVFAGAIAQNVSSGRDPQLAIVYLLIALLYFALGGGPWSLDALLARGDR